MKLYYLFPLSILISFAHLYTKSPYQAKLEGLQSTQEALNQELERGGARLSEIKTYEKKEKKREELIQQIATLEYAIANIKKNTDLLDKDRKNKQKELENLVAQLKETKNILKEYTDLQRQTLNHGQELSKVVQKKNKKHQTILTHIESTQKQTKQVIQDYIDEHSNPQFVEQNKQLTEKIENQQKTKNAISHDSKLIEADIERLKKYLNTLEREIELLTIKDNKNYSSVSEEIKRIFNDYKTQVSFATLEKLTDQQLEELRTYAQQEQAAEISATIASILQERKTSFLEKNINRFCGAMISTASILATYIFFTKP